MFVSSKDCISSPKTTYPSSHEKASLKSMGADTVSATVVSTCEGKRAVVLLNNVNTKTKSLRVNYSGSTRNF